MAAITNCRLVVARGMGFGAHHYITGAGMQAVITDQWAIDDARPGRDHSCQRSFRGPRALRIPPT
jgi:hypothetical protein